METIRDRLTALAAPLGIQLPEEYIAFMEAEPERGILVYHLLPEGEPPQEWWPEPIEELEADIHRGRCAEVVLGAHYLRSTAAEYLSGGWTSIPGPGGSEFRTERLGRGFWIGEVDGDCVFIDAETLGVFAYLEYADENRVEQWAPSFAEFVARGQQRQAAPGAAADGGGGSGFTG